MSPALLAQIERPESVAMVTRDGVRLWADIYRPAIPGRFPVLLMRQPYGRTIASTVVYAHPCWYAAQGYVVVVQDVRGRGDSEGSFDPFVHDMADGFDSIEWAARLPGTTGAVGMYGFSYQGMTQLFAAVSGHPALKAICPAMAGVALREDWAYEGGAFRLHDSLTWAAQLAAETARRAGRDADYVRLCALAHAPSRDVLIDPDAAELRALLGESFYADWRDRAASDPYWRARSPLCSATALSIPALHIGGWFDAFLGGTLRAYDLCQASPAEQRLVIGPWGHLPWTRRIGDRDLGPSADSPIDHLQLAWFDRHLKDHDGGNDTAPVRLFDLTACVWRDFPAWPVPTPTRLFTAGTGRANLTPEEGALGPEPGAGADTFVHDPWRPVPSLGGHCGPEAGMRERSAVDARPDVLTYTTAPLPTDRQLAGQVRAHIACMASAPSFDLSAVLSWITPEGAAWNLTQGHARLSGNGMHEVPMRAVCAHLPAGHRLRLSIAGACFPAFDLNGGTAQARPTQRRPVALTVCHGAEGTCLDLPWVDTGMDGEASRP